MRTNQVKEESFEKRGMVLPLCKLCGEVPLRGIIGGYLINRNFVCESCENTIVNLEIGSQEYDFYVQEIKKIIK